ncbi:3'-5' exonuclease [Zeimonas arvi]|uniref:3'-5' exonuclease n=1 Tax=Zeimonas arvi TaxID=2498847 RepID=A0A5C8NIE1_9BURK|nr:3'-5' exonuclease [Zeimonas arvi]TXL61664.1 3'-5' exonuclease [Zeimonas arvi]
MTPTLVFDIETIPDAQGLRSAWGIDPALPDDEVVELAFARQLEKTDGRSDFLPHHLHKVVAIACLMHDARGFHVKCLGTPEDSEGKLVQQFFGLIDRFTPQLVSWNGGGFDLQVLHYRGLIHGVQAPRYWESGDEDRDFKWNNYLSRYHTRHLDLMDQLALFTPRANAPLDELARLCGFPGKMGMDGSQVWPAFREGRIGEIRDYCETDVANTWLVFARFQLMRGLFTPDRYAAEVAALRRTLAALADGGAAHWREFLDAWPQS